MTDWNKLIEHADGRDCKCAAYSYTDCGCDADWTPREVYKLRHRVEALEAVVEAAREIDKYLGDVDDVTVTHISGYVEAVRNFRDAIASFYALQDGKEKQP